ncbi:MAG: transglycosylase domain-containing protein [Pseudomonadota bacterium]|nr:transglycosylase domain-containing protein [Pseudomonadota bacterium]
MIRRALLALLIVVVVYAVYLGSRIVVERRTVSARVDAIIAAAAPSSIPLTPARTAQLLKVEDPTFFTNKGIDFSSPGAGMTTISQSLGKRLFFDDFSPGFAKGELIALTRFALYPEVNKERVLQAFLATAYFGRRDGRAVIGIGAAARAWFGRPLATLSEQEFLMLIAMLPAPAALDPYRHAAANAERVARIERLLADQCRPSGLRDVMLEGCARQ